MLSKLVQFIHSGHTGLSPATSNGLMLLLPSGMLTSAETIEVVAKTLHVNLVTTLVVDPVGVISAQVHGVCSERDRS
jgi:hypothetical protein